ncbi:hypothetical protein DDB_G0271580 [Dictyostelium discoideum AX4]|uniref:Uncharacterized protein n=1 Tax=Dictyostelium discoideum TaxID=44689 RepID=Q55AU6_DICDI|nr:hypothetical protein DDB_G0271580 [Dictyostelium discoideum AX4]EAL71654.1 hypothetical protein DDB_G0271580 [Dictyostelium discoideum AX4]|eukprot:XP_645600.1 hypothetical protein DDB_G0271580 [Dictyostelium discoideum AX4]
MIYTFLLKSIFISCVCVSNPIIKRYYFNVEENRKKDIINVKKFFFKINKMCI